MCVYWMSAPLPACDLQSVDVSADMIAFWKLRLKRAASGVNGGRQPAGGEVTAALQTGGSEYGLSGEKLNLLGWSRRSFSQLTVICMLWISHTHIHPPLAWWWSWIRFYLATKNRSGERTHDSLCVSTNQHFFFLQGGFVTLAWHHHLLHPFLLWERGCNSTTPQSLMMESVKPQSTILIIRNRTQVASKTLCRPGDAFKLIPFCTFFRCSTTLLFWS